MLLSNHGYCVQYVRKNRICNTECQKCFAAAANAGNCNFVGPVAISQSNLKQNGLPLHENRHMLGCTWKSIPQNIILPSLALYFDHIPFFCNLARRA